ncbi:hypothetical protein BJ742DRAFT_379708 [Cladochytrium replicatum]|nr:hypothetical protein BJ742DRAFT_379708 [Cladochytrium replicatum]
MELPTVRPQDPFRWRTMLEIYFDSVEFRESSYRIFIAILVRLLLWMGAFAGFIELSYRFKVSEFSSVWLGNGVVVGASILVHSHGTILGMMYKFLLLPLGYFSVNFALGIRVYGVATAAVFASLNVFQVLLILAISSLGLEIALWFRDRFRKAPVHANQTAEEHFNRAVYNEQLSVDNREHLTILLVATLASSAITSSISAAYNTSADVSYSSIFQRWFASDFGGYCLVTPAVLALGSSRHQKHLLGFWTRTISMKRWSRIWRVSVVISSILLVAGIPLTLPAVISRLPFTFTISLYFALFFIVYISSVLGAIGCGISVFILGMSSQGSIILFPRVVYGIPSEELPDQLLLGQVVLIAIAFTSFGFLTVYRDKDRTIELVEEIVRERTDQLSDALDSLRIAQAATERSSQLKTNFINYVAHEIRNPLHAILNLGEDILLDLGSEIDPSQIIAKDPDQDWVSNFLPSAAMGWSGFGRPQRARTAPMSVPLVERTISQPIRVFKQSTEKVSVDGTSALTREHIRSIRSIIVSARHTLSLVNDMLEIGSSEARDSYRSLRRKLKPVTVDLRILFTEAIFPALRSATASNQRVRFASQWIDSSGPDIAQIDPERLQQIAANLVAHSLKNTAPGGQVEIRVTSRLATTRNGGMFPIQGWARESIDFFLISEPQNETRATQITSIGGSTNHSAVIRGKPPETRQSRVFSRTFSGESRPTSRSPVNESPSLRSVASEHELVMTIRDNGRGIPADKIAQLFEAYTQTSVASAREVGGSALGLSITYQLVKAMGGDIFVSSEDGEGTVVIVTLPIVPPLDVPSRSSADTGSTPSARQTESQTDEVVSVNAETELRSIRIEALRTRSLPVPRRDRRWGTGRASPGGYASVRQQEVGDNASDDIPLSVASNIPPSPWIIRTPSADQSTAQPPVMGILAAIPQTLPEIRRQQFSEMNDDIPPSVMSNYAAMPQPLSELVGQPSSSTQLGEHMSQTIVTSSSESLYVHERTTAKLTPQTSQQDIVAASNSATINSETPAEPTVSSYEVENPTVILVVEDEPINRQILLRILKRVLPAKFTVREAEDGIEAVRLLDPSFTLQAPTNTSSTSSPPPSVERISASSVACILLDVVMPNMDGYQAAQNLRKLGCSAPIIVTTANEIESTHEQFREVLDRQGLQGIRTTLQKPFGRLDVIRTLKECGVLKDE